MPLSTTVRAALAVLSLAGAATSTLAQATFQPIDLGGAQGGLSVFCSHDGKAVSLSGAQGGIYRAMRWTELDGAVALAAPCTPNQAGESFAISANGRYVAGQAYPPGGSPAFLWSAASGLVEIGDMPGGPLACWPEAVSDDGQVVAGVGNWEPHFSGQAFRWTPGGGFAGLGYLRPHYTYSDAVAMTTDGSVIVGWSGLTGVEFRGFIWTQATGMVDLPAPPAFEGWYSPWGMTPDGAYIVGNYVHIDGSTIPIRWDSGGNILELGNVPGGPPVGAAWASSDDGNVIVGFDHYTYDATSESSIAMIWDPVNGPRDLKQVLEIEHGLNLTGWTLTSATDISGDGTVIVGFGVDPTGASACWKVEVPAKACTADINKDGLVDFADYLEFLNFFDAGC
ncbi:MAG: hypothetical protein IT436_11440 [Phycisphaerales bacterium]|nr:hypothetical protein [Phycisphaerales bacterium]